MVAFISGAEPEVPAPNATPPDALTPTPAANQPPTEPVPEPPESTPPPSPRRLSLDRLGVVQALGGLGLSLIALFSSYDHINLLGHRIELQQQWGIVCIAASLATVLVDAELASRSRLRAAQNAARMADKAARERYFSSEERERADRERNEANRERYLADRERNLADRERHRADRERNRAAAATERQRQATARLDRCALLSARVQRDPSASNRARAPATEPASRRSSP